MTIMPTLCASKSRSAPKPGTVGPRRQKYRQNYLTPATESVLMVDKLDGADDAVAIRFVPGYDNLCLA